MTNGVNKYVGAGLAGAAGLGTGLIVGRLTSSKRRSKKTRKRKAHSRMGRKRSNSRRRRSRSSTNRKYSTRKIHYTKHGQPYVKLRSGKARFITKRGARSSRKRKGGRY